MDLNLQPSSIEEQKKNFHRDFNDPKFYVCEIFNKEEDRVIGILPFTIYSKIDAMVIINSLANKINIPTENISFICLENSNILFSAKAENEKFKLNVLIQDINNEINNKTNE